MNNLTLTQMTQDQNRITVSMVSSLVHSYKTYHSLVGSDCSEEVLEGLKWTYRGKLEMLDTFFGGGLMSIIREYFREYHMASTTYGLLDFLGK